MSTLWLSLGGCTASDLFGFGGCSHSKGQRAEEGQHEGKDQISTSARGDLSCFFTIPFYSVPQLPSRTTHADEQVVFGLKSTNNGKPDLGLTMQADYHGNRAVVKGFSLVDGKVKDEGGRSWCRVTLLPMDLT